MPLCFFASKTIFQYSILVDFSEIGVPFHLLIDFVLMNSGFIDTDEL